MSVWTLEKAMEARMVELEGQVRILNRHMAKISENLEWIASCHYQHFTTESTHTAGFPMPKPTSKCLEWDCQ